MRSEAKLIIGFGILMILVVVSLAWFGSKPPTPTGPADPALLVRPDSQKIEAPGARVILVEFGDYQCPACAAAEPVIKQVLKDYQGRITFVFRNFPLPNHEHAMISAEAAEVAGDQGKFWEMHDLLYERQDVWVKAKSPKDEFIKYAGELGLNVSEFTSSLNASKYESRIRRDQNDGNSLSVNATPTFYVNGKKLMLTSSNDLINAIKSVIGASATAVPSSTISPQASPTSIF